MPKILTGKPIGKSLFGRPMLRGDGNIRTDFTKICINTDFEIILFRIGIFGESL